MPAVSITPRPPTAAEWLLGCAWLTGVIVVLPLLVGVPIWLLIKMGKEIIQSQPKSE